MDHFLFSIFPNERFVDLGLYQYGWEECKPLHSYGPYARNHYLFHYVISGTGILESTDSNGVTSTYKIKSGEGFMIFPKQVNTYYADKEHPWEYTWLEFDGLRVKEVLELAGLDMDHPVYHSNARDLTAQLKNENALHRTESHPVPLPSDWAFVPVFGLFKPLLCLPAASSDRKDAGFLRQGSPDLY